MASLSLDRLATLLDPFLAVDGPAAPADLFPRLGLYLDLLLKWNARTNLTAIRDAETIVTRHFGESLFLAAHLPPEVQTLLDLGSGAGFPGLPTQLLRPELQVMLAESQGKKSAFLREAVRSLALTTAVHAGRAEDLVGSRYFDVVALRAVDNMDLALRLSRKLGTRQVLLTTAEDARMLNPESVIPVPMSDNRVLAILG